MQVIRKHASKFLTEMDAKAIASELHELDKIPEAVKNLIERAIDTSKANAELLNFLKRQASDDQIEEIFKHASEQTLNARMSRFAADVLEELQ